MCWGGGGGGGMTHQQDHGYGCEKSSGFAERILQCCNVLLAGGGGVGA